MPIVSFTMKEPSPLQLEIHQSRPFRSLGHEGVVALLRTADLVRRGYNRVLEEYEITLQQYNVLRILRGAGEAGVPTLTIAERMIEEAPGVTRLLDRLEAKDLVRRERCRQDRRQVLCWLTSKGSELLETLESPVDETDRASLAMLSCEDQERLIRLLDIVRAGHAGPH